MPVDDNRVTRRKEKAHAILEIEGAGILDAVDANRPRGQRSHAVIDILKPDDVVLAEICATLHFNQFDRLQSEVFKPVNRSQRNVSVLIDTNNADLFVDRDSGLTSDH